MAGTRFGGRTLARSQALQLLFQSEATGRLVSEVLEGEYAIDEGPLIDYAEELARGCDAMLHELDAVIGSASSNWSVSRMASVDRNLLRLALYEMLQVDEVDTAVAIDECVELAKAYGTDESSRFVNGLLGRVARLRDEGVDVVAAALEELAAREDAEAEAEDGQVADDAEVEVAEAAEGAEAEPADEPVEPVDEVEAAAAAAVAEAHTAVDPLAALDAAAASLAAEEAAEADAAADAAAEADTEADAAAEDLPDWAKE